VAKVAPDGCFEVLYAVACKACHKIDGLASTQTFQYWSRAMLPFKRPIEAWEEGGQLGKLLVGTISGRFQAAKGLSRYK
jgi:hypothetical protein